MAWQGSLSRSLVNAAARSSTASAARALPRARPPPFAAPRFTRHRPSSFASPRSLGELGCTHSLLPLHTIVTGSRLASHLSVNFRAWCELSQGT